MSLKNKKIYISGHNGMVGSSLFKYLKKKGFRKIITINRKNLDLTNFDQVNKFIRNNKPDFVIIFSFETEDAKQILVGKSKALPFRPTFKPYFKRLGILFFSAQCFISITPFISLLFNPSASTSSLKFTSTNSLWSLAICKKFSIV